MATAAVAVLGCAGGQCGRPSAEPVDDHTDTVRTAELPVVEGARQGIHSGPLVGAVGDGRASVWVQARHKRRHPHSA